MQSEQHQNDGYGHLIPGGLTRKSVSIAKLPTNGVFAQRAAVN